MKKVAINGFGRIGRILFRVLHERSDVEVCVINDLAKPDILSHLLKYDSVHGRFLSNVDYFENCIIVDDRKIPVLNQPDISSLNWRSFNIDIVFECTGFFKTYEENLLHIKAGADQVILTAPPSDNKIDMVVLGVNDDVIHRNNNIISNASCTTNCAAPMIQVLNDYYTVQSAYVTTVHSYTSDQNLHDGIHVDLRRARAASSSIIPTSTGAAKALSHIFPNIKISGCGIRVPVSNCSLTDITCIVKNKTNIEEVNKLFKTASKSSLNNILYYNSDPIVSVDVKSSIYSCVFDSLLTYVSGRMIKIVGWYDNEYGYCSRLADLLSRIS